MKHTKLFLEWLFMGYWTHFSYKRFVFGHEFVGPIRTLYDEMMQELTEMQQRQKVRRERAAAKHELFMRRHERWKKERQQEMTRSL